MAAMVTASLLLVSGCATAPVEEPAAVPSPSPSATEEPATSSLPAIEVPITSGSIENQSQPPAAPTQVIMPSTGIDMSVVSVGVDNRNYMEIPESVREAGWYKFGPGPESAEGATVLAAHVDFPGQGVGPFANLRDAQVGAEISVVDEAGVTHIYRVVTVERIPKAEVSLDQVFTKDGAPTLVLITCGGSFDRNAGSYSDNYIVTAEKVS